jgi:hypothetical protein
VNAFRERVYTGNWPEASLLNSLLETEEIQTVVVEALGARRGGPHEIYVLNESQIVRAREIVDRFVAGAPLVDPKTDRSWRCPHCNELIEGQFDVCWKCGRSR